MIDWIRPSGRPITTDDQDCSIEYAISAGWELVKDDTPNEEEETKEETKEEVKPAPKKPKAKTKKK